MRALACLFALACAGCAVNASPTPVALPLAPSARLANGWCYDPMPSNPMPGELSPPDARDEVDSAGRGLDRDEIQQIIRSHIPAVAACYEAGLLVRPDAAGRVVVRFAISPSGAVRASRIDESTLAFPEVEECVGLEVCSWRFPEPHGGGGVIVSYPFNFTPAAQ